MYTLHSEVALFPVSFGERGLRHASFKIAFPPAFLAQLRLLVDLGLAETEPVTTRGPRKGSSVKVAPRELLVALLAARQAQQTVTDAPATPSDCDVLRVIATGTRDGHSASLVEEVVVKPYLPWGVGAGDIDTGIPLAIAGILLAQGQGRLKGVHGAELLFEPVTFLRELARYGMCATETITHTLS
jgi:saccharopine dehydrogenase (NAD+, L-lysine-forming)